MEKKVWNNNQGAGLQMLGYEKIRDFVEIK